MKQGLLKLIALSAVMLIISCQNNQQVELALSSADKIVCADPDSALRILHEIDTANISDQQRAYLNLLETKASDKADLDPHDINPIDYAARVFKGRNDSIEAQALYYKGVVQYNNADYGRALVSLMQAHEVADQCGDLFYKAMSSRSMSDVYNAIVAFEPAATASSNAIDEFYAAGRPDYAKFEKYILPFYLLQSNKIEKADSILDENAKDAFFLETPLRLNWYYTVRALSEYKKGDYKTALYWYNLACDEVPQFFVPNDWSRMASCYIKLGQGEDAQKALDSARVHIRFDTDSAYMILAEAELYALKGDYQKAFQIKNEFYRVENIKRNYLLTHPYTTMLSDYLASEAAMNLHRYKLAEYKLWLWILIAAVLGVFAVMVYILHVRKVKIDNVEKEILISDIRRLKEEIKEVHPNYDKNRINTNGSEKGIFDSSFINFVDNLLTIDNQAPDSEEGNKYLRKTFKTTLNNVKSIESLHQIEKFVDYNNGNIMQKLKDQIPSLTVKQLNYFMFKVAGFSNTSICQLLDMKNMNALHQLKSRLKNKIKSSEWPDREYFLEMLDIKL